MRLAASTKPRQTVEGLVHYLNQQACDAGLLNHSVNLSSTQIYHPNPYYDLAQGGFELKSEHAGGNPEHSVAGVDGPFFGFASTLQVVEGDISQIKGSIHYRVGIPATMNMPHLIGGKACAHAPIGSSELTFQLDRRCHDANWALSTLTQPTEDGFKPNVALRILTHKLYNTLTFNTVDAPGIRLAGRMVREYMNKHGNTTPPHVSDALLDYISAQLGAGYGNQFRVSAGYGILTREQLATYVESPKLLSTLQGVTYSPYIRTKGGFQYAEESQHAPTIAGSVGESDAICRVPLERVRILKPVDVL